MVTEGEGSPRPWTGSGASCICKDEDQDVLSGWWCLSHTDCAATQEGATNSRRSTWVDNEAGLGPESKESQTMLDCSTD